MRLPVSHMMGAIPFASVLAHRSFLERQDAADKLLAQENKRTCRLARLPRDICVDSANKYRTLVFQ